MRLLLRSLLVWLMVLALPLQGMAAASLRHCAGLHEQVQTAAVAAGEHQHGDAHAHAHAGHAQHATQEPAAATPAGKCSACAACCAALGLPASAVRVPAAPPQALPAQAVVPGLDSFVPDGLDRPPRRRAA